MSVPEKLVILEGEEAINMIMQKSAEALPQWAKQQIADQQAEIEQLVRELKTSKHWLEIIYQRALIKRLVKGAKLARDTNDWLVLNEVLITAEKMRKDLSFANEVAIEKHNKWCELQVLIEQLVKGLEFAESDGTVMKRTREAVAIALAKYREAEKQKGE